MKKLVLFTVTLCCIFLFVSCSDSSAKTAEVGGGGKDIVLIDFSNSNNSKGLTIFPPDSTLNHPYGGGEPIDLSQISNPAVRTQANFVGFALQTTPMIPGLTQGNSKKLTTLKDTPFKAHGFQGRIATIKENEDGFFERCYLYDPSDSHKEHPFYQIDYYYSYDKKAFSYRAIFVTTFGKDFGDTMYYFELKNIEIDNLAFSTTFDSSGLSSNGRWDKFKFKEGTSQYYDSVDFLTSNMMVKFSNDQTASCLYVIQDAYGLPITSLNLDATEKTNFHYNDGKFELTTDTPYGSKGFYSYELFDVNVASKIMEPYYTYSGEFPMLRTSFTSMEEFNDATLIPNVSLSAKKYATYYPMIYSLKKKTGACIDPENHSEGRIYSGIFSAPYSEDGVRERYLPGYKDFSGYYDGDNVKPFKDFILNHLQNCGFSESDANTIYGKMNGTSSTDYPLS